MWFFLAWYDPDKKKPARHKLDDAIERYGEKFGTAPELALVNAQTAEEIGADPPLPVETAPYIPRWTFYVGTREDEA